MHNNSFSWERMSLLTRYYMPAIKRQLIIYTVLIAVYCLSSVLKGTTFWWSFMFVMLAGILQFCFSYLYYLAPIAFSRYDDPVLSTLLPAKGSEKAVFIIGYSLVFIPLFITAVLGVFTLIIHILHPDSSMSTIFYGADYDTVYEVFEFAPMWFLYINKYIGYFWMTSIILYVVTICHTNKLLKAIVTSIIVPLATGILGVIIGAIYSFYNKNSILTKIENLKDMGDYDNEAAGTFVNSFVDILSTWLISYQGFMTIVGIICVVLTWRRIAHNQV